MALAIFGAVRSASTPIYKHGGRYARSPFNLGALFGGCSGKCNSQGYRYVTRIKNIVFHLSCNKSKLSNWKCFSFLSVGRSLAFAGGAVGVLGLLTNNRQLQQVGGSALAGGVGLKTVSKVIGR